MHKHFAVNLFSLLILLTVISTGVVYWGKTEFYKPGPLQEALFIEVPDGGRMKALSKVLVEKGAIQNAMVMRVGSRYLEMDALLKFGNYEIPAEASTHDILKIVTKGGRSNFRYIARYNVKVASSAELTLRERVAGEDENKVLASFVVGEPMPREYSDLRDAKKPISYQISVAEGTTSWQIIEAIKQADFLIGPAPDVPKEGSMAPDTIEVASGTLRSDVVDKMIAAQSKILADAWESRAKDLPLKSPEEALTLASIVEKETGVKSEREEVAGVFINRLNKGMKLQTDPTVIYGLTEGKAPFGRGLRRSELSKKTDYNTYIIPGLPLGPIANPGRAAIEAVLNPAKTKNLFFVADGTGGHVFTDTLAKHNANVAKWRKIEAQRRKTEQKSNNN